MTMPKVGQWVELCQNGQGGPQWLPFLITAVHDAETVSGVAFCGQPMIIGWHRPVGNFTHAKWGENPREWRETAAVPAGAAGEGDIAEAVKAVVADMLPSPDEFKEMMGEAARQAVAEAALDAPDEDEAPAEAPAAPPAADDLTVIPRLGAATAAWLGTHDIDSFAALAAVDDEDIEVLADDADAPSGVTEERLREWREDAAGRAA